MRKLRVYACLLMIAGFAATGCDPNAIVGHPLNDPHLCAQTNKDACTPNPDPKPPVLADNN